MASPFTTPAGKPKLAAAANDSAIGQSPLFVGGDGGDDGSSDVPRVAELSDDDGNTGGGGDNGTKTFCL